MAGRYYNRQGGVSRCIAELSDRAAREDEVTVFTHELLDRRDSRARFERVRMLRRPEWLQSQTFAPRAATALRGQRLRRRARAQPAGPPARRLHRALLPRGLPRHAPRRGRPARLAQPRLSPARRRARVRAPLLPRPRRRLVIALTPVVKAGARDPGRRRPGAHPRDSERGRHEAFTPAAPRARRRASAVAAADRRAARGRGRAAVRGLRVRAQGARHGDRGDGGARATPRLHLWVAGERRRRGPTSGSPTGRDRRRGCASSVTRPSWRRSSRRRTPSSFPPPTSRSASC